MLCEVSCRKVNFEEIWCRKNVELHKSTKYVQILRLTAVVLQSYALQIPFWCMMVPPKSEMQTESSAMAGKVMPKAPKGALMNRNGCKRTPKGSQLKPKGWHQEPKRCQKRAKWAPKMHPKIDVQKRLQMGPLPESNFPYKTGGKLHIFIFFKVFFQKVDFMEICVSHGKYKVF